MPSTRPFDRLYLQLRGEEPPAAVAHGESGAELLRPGRGFMDGFDLTMQDKVGCPAACLFCYVPTSFGLAPSDVRKNWGFDVRTKADAARKLHQHLNAGGLADKTVYWSGVTDPYAATPALTRELWEILGNSAADLRPLRIVVQTRFRPDRDVALLVKYIRSTASSDGGPPVVVSYSVGTDRDDLIRAWERATPCFESRLHAIKTLCDGGVCVVATLSPFAAWNDLRGAACRLRDLGVAYLTVLFFKEHTGATTTPKPFLDYLRREFPHLLDPGWQSDRLDELESVFGSDRVLVGKPGFSSLAAPHLVGGQAHETSGRVNGGDTRSTVSHTARRPTIFRPPDAPAATCNAVQRPASVSDALATIRKAPSRVIPYSAQRVTAYAVFDRIVRGFLSGTMSQLIVGPRGVQKSKTIEGLLGGRAQYVVGRTTAWGLYHALYLYRDRLIVLDDLDRLYALPDAVALLKCVAAKAARKTVGWNSDRTLKDTDVPRSFATTSRVILVANRWVTSNDDVLALEDRCITVFFQPSPAEVHARARAWVVAQDREVYDFVGAHLDRCRELSMRLYDTAMEYKRYGLDWRRIVLELLDAGPPEEEPEVPEQVVQSLQAADLPSHRDRVRAFREQTGQSQATYYRIRKRLLDSPRPRGV
jgi:DNA repair photolyase